MPEERETPDATPASAPWSPRDFVLYGRYAEPEAVAAAVERLRTATGSRAAILLAYHGRTIFHSLLLLAHDDKEVEADLQHRLRLRPRFQLDGASPFEQFARGELDAPTVIDELRDRPPFERIDELLSGDVRIVGREIDRDRRDAVGLSSVPIQALLVEPRAEQGAAVDEALDDLLVLVNASAAVVVHANIETERKVDAALDRVNRSVGTFRDSRSIAAGPGSETLRSFADSLLQQALTLTNSRVGNVYFANRDGRNLTLVAHQHNLFLRESLAIDDPRSIVSWVHRRRRPMVINDIQDFLHRNPSSGYINVAGAVAPYAELAVPIVQHGIGGGPGKVIGVVNVEKVPGYDTGRFTYRDVTILRSVAHRLSLWRAQSMAHEAASSLAALTKLSAGWSSPAASYRAAEREQVGRDARLPVEAFAARDIIETTLSSIHELTRSYSVSLRLLSPDRRWLIRFAAYPFDRMNDTDGVIWIGRRNSVNAWVAREGRECSLWNVRDRAARRQYKGLDAYWDVGREITSELCLPIFVAGRLVGVLNLESRFLDGYADATGLGAAVAEQIGLAIQYARRSYEQTVLSMSTATTANVHELGKLADRLREMSGSTGAGDVAELAEIARLIDECSRSGADVVEGPLVSTSELVRQTLRDLSLTDHFVLRDEGRSDAVHTGTEALGLRVALTALLDNASRNADNDDPSCYVAWRKGSIGGRSYVTLMIGNNITLALDESRVRDLFRRPIRDPRGRLRLGAFTAGALVRALGGDVFIRHAEPPRFVVGVDLPLSSTAVALEEAA